MVSPAGIGRYLVKSAQARVNRKRPSQARKLLVLWREGKADKVYVYQTIVVFAGRG